MRLFQSSKCKSCAGRSRSAPHRPPPAPVVAEPWSGRPNHGREESGGLAGLVTCVTVPVRAFMNSTKSFFS